MSTECYPIATLPHTTRLYRDFLAMGDSSPAMVERDSHGGVASATSLLARWYGAEPLGRGWMHPAAASANADGLANALESQSISFGASPTTLAQIAKLRNGARAIVTGQQVGLLGGPLLTLLKAATAIARARQATAATGVDHVPIFWLASEDHDGDEVDQVSLLSNTAIETLRTGDTRFHGIAMPVGEIAFQGHIDGLLDRACELLGHAPICDLLRECYGYRSANDYGPTFASGFARLMTRLFAEQGLIVMDAAGRDFHTLGAPTLRYAIEHAGELEAALLARAAELEAAGYHAQVLVKAGTSLLFLISDVEGHPGVRNRLLLRRLSDGAWKAGTGNTAKTYSTADLLAILDSTPERLSPNALLRPVFQDTILPTTAYIGGPAEVAYFAQSGVLYQRILRTRRAGGGAESAGETIEIAAGRITPILPRLSATLLEPAIEHIMAQHEVTLPDAFTTPDALAQRLAAGALPIEAKRCLADAGDALDQALGAAECYLAALDPSLGRSAKVSASKMRYQMNRLRRLAATFELHRETSLRKHAEAITLHLFPEGHLQERVLAGAWFLAAWDAAHSAAPGSIPGAGLISRLVEEAANQCPGHLVIRL